MLALRHKGHPTRYRLWSQAEGQTMVEKFWKSVMSVDTKKEGQTNSDWPTSA